MKDKVLKLINDLEKELIVINETMYHEPELGYEEFKSSKLHVNLLEKYGFDVEENYLDLSTAFRAEYTSKKEGPTISYLVEYDALPDIGHGCGHNILGTVSTGAGIVLKEVIDEIGGKVIVLGTPAEETGGAKVVFADAGIFKDIDIALMAHPGNSYYKSGGSLAIEALQFSFTGKATHAAASPDKGINALDAVISTFNSINALREHIISDARIHGIIKNGGVAPNIVPDYAVAQFYVRAPKKAYLGDLVKKVKNCARGAELATATKLKIENYELGYDDMMTNETLSNVFNKYIEGLGCKIIDAKENSGSLDAGNVSYCCPTIHPFFDITNDTSVTSHTKEFADNTITEYAYKQMKNAIAALVLTAIEVINDKELLMKIKDEFNNINS